MFNKLCIESKTIPLSMLIAENRGHDSTGLGVLYVNLWDVFTHLSQGASPIEYCADFINDSLSCH